MNTVLNLVPIAMIIALLIPIYEAWRNTEVWGRLLALASVASKAGILMLFISVLRDDWMIGVAAIIILSVGNAGLMLLAHILKRLGET
jgi:multicomponent Na+:H+ antiporter subunit F